MSGILDDLKNCTYTECFECSSYYKMEYFMGEYGCPECYRTITFDKAITEKEIEINWTQLKKYIEEHETPRLAMKMFIVKIMKKDWTNYDLNNLIHKLITNGKFEL